MSSNDTLVNGRSPVTKVSSGTTVKFPDVCKTPVGNAIVPIPYPNVSKSGDLAKGSKTVKINGAPACLSSSEIATSTGDEAGSAKGIASGTTKGKAFPMNYSFDVKCEGKPMVRNGDPFIGNNRNTPPLPIMQAQPVYTPMQEQQEKCPYCGKVEHPFARQFGTNLGNGRSLRNHIFESKQEDDHPWHAGKSTLAAHHLICSEAMKHKQWRDYCSQFGYSINHRNNGVMLPMTLALACQLNAPVHIGGHIGGWADDLHLPYPKAVKKKIKPVKDAIKKGRYCDNPEGVVEELDNKSREILANIDAFTWTITSDGKDYRRGDKGCCGANKIPDKKGQACPHQRQHQLKHAKTGAIIPAKSQSLKIGE
ncbi:MAG: DUF4150 domain-containing protein [Gammaproteobacteria bacterium]|nr:DUF4150 domain-containing protein [Gammaproteobacteria bacterium]